MQVSKWLLGFPKWNEATNLSAYAVGTKEGIFNCFSRGVIKSSPRAVILFFSSLRHIMKMRFEPAHDAIKGWGGGCHIPNWCDAHENNEGYSLVLNWAFLDGQTLGAKILLTTKTETKLLFIKPRWWKIMQKQKGGGSNLWTYPIPDPHCSTVRLLSRSKRRHMLPTAQCRGNSCRTQGCDSKIQTNRNAILRGGWRGSWTFSFPCTQMISMDIEKEISTHLLSNGVVSSSGWMKVVAVGQLQKMSYMFAQDRGPLAAGVESLACGGLRVCAKLAWTRVSQHLVLIRGAECIKRGADRGLGTLHLQTGSWALLRGCVCSACRRASCLTRLTAPEEAWPTCASTRRRRTSR